MISRIWQYLVIFLKARVTHSGHNTDVLALIWNEILTPWKPTPKCVLISIEWDLPLNSEEEKDNDSNKWPYPSLVPKTLFAKKTESRDQVAEDGLNGQSLLSQNASWVTTLGFCIGVSFYMWGFRAWYLARKKRHGIKIFEMDGMSMHRVSKMPEPTSSEIEIQ